MDVTYRSGRPDEAAPRNRSSCCGLPGILWRVSTSKEASGERLSKTALRDFGPPIPHDERDFTLPSYRVTLLPQEAPIPVLLRHALALIGIPHSGLARRWRGG